MTSVKTPTPESAKFWHDPALHQLELLRATYITHVFAPHAHEGFAIGIIEAGAQTFIHQGRNTLVMPAGCVAIVNPGETHIGKATTEAGWTYRMFYPDAAVLQTVASELHGRTADVPFFPDSVIFDPLVFHSIRAMHTALEDPHTSHLERETLLLQTLARLILRHADYRPAAATVLLETALMRKVRDYLRDHYAENVSLSQLAAQVSLNKSYLIRAFRRAYGLPPHAYQNQVRIEQAKHLLLAGLPVADVAAATGFVDQSHLTRRFRQIVGVPPGKFRLV
ncbi:MAG TPA: AraC family transcriptional regulator [Phototrophicaceae bacterium]|nr:AraC family transcriptional regulator [Phototrophicaceae bacterium]